MIQLQDGTLQIEVMVGEQVYIRLFDTNHETGFYLPKGELLSIDELIDVAFDALALIFLKQELKP